MSSRWLLWLMAVVFYSCNSNQEGSKESVAKSEELISLEKKIDSLHRLVAQLMPKDADSLNVPVTTDIKPGNPSLPTPREIIKEAPKPMETKNLQKAKEDTVFHYYRNSSKISVIITPWKDGRRKLQLFDPWGKMTYEHEDALLSYQHITTIKSFHSNGAVSEMHESLNPGGGIQHYDSKITVGINNDPEWKVVTEYPPDLEKMSNNQWYWSKKEWTWKKQETVIETILPEK